MKNIKVIILKSGMEIISQVEGDRADGSISLHRPLKSMLIPIPVPKPEGMSIQFQAQLLPVVSLVKAPNITVQSDDIWMVLDPPKELEYAYLQQTSGIQMAPAGSIIK